MSLKNWALEGKYRTLCMGEGVKKIRHHSWMVPLSKSINQLLSFEVINLQRQLLKLVK